MTDATAHTNDPGGQAMAIQARLQEIDQGLGRLGGQMDALREEVLQNDIEIDALQVDVKKATKSWYRDASTLIALLALLLSFGTTYYSYRQAETQRVLDARVELRGLVQRLSEIQIENATLAQNYPDPQVLGAVSGMIQEENAMLAKHAVEIMEKIPQHVNSSEYLMVASALAGSSHFEQAIHLLDEALSTGVVTDVSDGVGILRTRGNYLFSLGDLERGRGSFQESLEIFETYPSPNEIYRLTTHALTEMYWAQAELVAGQCEQAREHIERARANISSVVIEGIPNFVAQQIEQTAGILPGCRPAPDQLSTTP